MLFNSCYIFTGKKSFPPFWIIKDMHDDVNDNMHGVTQVFILTAWDVKLIAVFSNFLMNKIILNSSSSLLGNLEVR